MGSHKSGVIACVLMLVMVMTCSPVSADRLTHQEDQVVDKIADMIDSRVRAELEQRGVRTRLPVASRVRATKETDGSIFVVVLVSSETGGTRNKRFSAMISEMVSGDVVLRTDWNGGLALNFLASDVSGLVRGDPGEWQAVEGRVSRLVSDDFTGSWFVYESRGSDICRTITGDVGNPARTMCIPREDILRKGCWDRSNEKPLSDDPTS